MRRTTLAATASLLFATPAAADQSISFWGSSQKLVHLSDVTMPGNSQSSTLCLQVERQHAAFIPYAQQSVGYALSDTNCQGSTFHPLSTKRLQQLKAAGFIPSTIDVVPPAAPGPAFPYLPQLVGTLIILLAAPLILNRRARKASQRMGRISGDPVYFDVLLSLMFHIARTDGIIEGDELRTIREVYSELTGASLSPEVTATKFTQILSDEAAISLGQNYRGPQAELILDAVLRVAGRGDGITREKMQFIRGLNSALALNRTGLRDLLNKAAQPPQKAQVA